MNKCKIKLDGKLDFTHNGEDDTPEEYVKS